MKLLPFLLLLFTQFAWSQFKTGTVVYVDFAQDELTLAADSRMNIGSGGHNDSECKISAFGSKFAFSMAGAARIGQWNAHSAAREVWKRESKSKSDATLLSRLINGWIEVAKPIYATRDLIADVRKHMSSGDDPVVATAFFAAVDNSGKLKASAVNIDFDLPLFDSTGEIKLISNAHEIPAASSISMGHDDVVIEFRHDTTQRAKEYMNWFRRRIAALPPHRQRAELASKYIELSILLHPKSNELAFPIDVLQLRADGVHWVWRKSNCPVN
jgi:hypothetical protein